MNIRQTMLVALLAAASLEAQTAGVIVGRITDASGAGVAERQSRTRQPEHRHQSTTTGSGQGEYVLPRVEPGTYQLTRQCARLQDRGP